MRFGLGLALGRRHAASAGDSAQKSMTLTVTTESDASLSSFNYAPLAVTVEANPTGFPANSNSYGTYDALQGEIQYLVDWGDTGATFTVPQNLPTEFKDRNTTQGRKSGHVYRSAGTFTVTVWAYDYLGNWATATTDITVKADDFTAANTVVLDTSGSFAGAPASDHQYTTWNAARTWIDSQAGTLDIIKVYGKYGDTYTPTNGLWLSSGPSVILDAWGTPANGRPIYELSSFGGTERVCTVGAGTSPGKLVCSNWVFTSYAQWDPTSELVNGTTVYDSFDQRLIYVDTANGDDILFDNVQTDGLSGFGLTVDGRGQCRLVAHEVEVKNGKEYWMYGGGTDYEFVYIGCYQPRPPGAQNGAASRWALDHRRNCHTGWRDPGSYDHDVIMHNCDIYSHHGWTIQNGVFDQSPLRINTGGTSTGSRWMYTRNMFEGSISNANHGTDPEVMSPTPMLFESNIFLTNNAQGGTPFTTQSVGTVFRNNIVIQPAGDKGAPLLATGNCSLYFHADFMTEAQRTSAPNIVQNNTFIDLRSDAQRNPSHVGAVNYSASYPVDIDMQVANNVWHAPNLTTPETSDGPLASTSLGFEGRYDGVKLGYAKWSGTITGGDVVNGGTLQVAYGTDEFGVTLTQSHFSTQTGRNAIKIGTSNLYDGFTPNYDEQLGDISTSFDASYITVTNNSGVTWTNGSDYVIHADFGTSAPGPYTAYATATGTTKTYAITASSASYEGASGNVPPLDFYGNPRRGSNHPDATAGTPSPGALEEVAAQTGSALLETGDVVLLETADAMLLG